MSLSKLCLSGPRRAQQVREDSRFHVPSGPVGEEFLIFKEKSAGRRMDVNEIFG